MQERIYLSRPHMGEEELKLVQDAFASNWITSLGPHVDGFEKELATYLEMDHCAVLSSGTAAIHLALIQLGISLGDEVICSTFTFSASCNPIVYQGATPVFVDSEPTTWNMDPMSLREAITDRVKKKGIKPKAIIIVHLYGMPARIDEIMAIAQEFEIPVIEDAAEALGSEFKGKKLGTFGDFGVFSFNGNKIITTGGGGALVSKNEEWIIETKFLATQARDKAPHYQHSRIGYNYRLSNVSAAIGRGQLRVLPTRIQQRRGNFDFYIENLRSYEGLKFLAEPIGYFSNRWLTTITLENSDNQPINRESVRLSLEKEDIECRPLWKPMHLQPIFSGSPYYGTRLSERLFQNGLCLPSGSDLTTEQRQQILDCLKKSLA